MQATLASIAGLAFVPVYIGLILQIRKIWVKQRPTTVLPLLMYAHVGRFAFWALLGAVLLHSDPISGWLLISTRGVGVLLTAITLVQRHEPRPPTSLLLRRAGPWCLAFSVLVVTLAVSPPPAWVRTALSSGVALSFAMLICWALPAQILEIHRSKDYRKLRFFQLALFGSYIAHLIYAVAIPDHWLSLLMLLVYVPATCLQALLVCQIEIGRLRYRRANGKA